MSVYIAPAESSYELLDSGEGMKLERFGSFTLVRPDPEALWPKRLSETIWGEADATYVRSGASGAWVKSNSFPKSWNISYDSLLLELRPTSFKHVGLFPEQIEHWQWLAKKITKATTERTEPIKVLNLFAYTGGATLSAARAGAHVTHVDSSSVALDWARTNAELSSLSDKPVRWIEDDVVAFLRREVKRGNRYDAIIMDPPAFGHGTKGVIWKIERDFYQLMELAFAVLSDNPIAVILNGYTAGHSPTTLANNLVPLIGIYGGTVESGELGVAESKSSRTLPCGVFARFSAK